MVDKKLHGRTLVSFLKRSSPEIPKLLTQFAASIAGTGLAVMFSVVCKVVYGKVPFCTSKLLSTGLGLGLVWLSSAVNKLRDTVISINKNNRKLLSAGEEEMMSSLDRNVKEIYFRAITIMAVAFLRFVWYLEKLLHFTGSDKSQVFLHRDSLWLKKSNHNRHQTIILPNFVRETVSPRNTTTNILYIITVFYMYVSIFYPWFTGKKVRKETSNLQRNLLVFLGDRNIWSNDFVRWSCCSCCWQQN